VTSLLVCDGSCYVVFPVTSAPSEEFGIPLVELDMNYSPSTFIFCGMGPCLLPPLPLDALSPLIALSFLRRLVVVSFIVLFPLFSMRMRRSWSSGWKSGVMVPTVLLRCSFHGFSGRIIWSLPCPIFSFCQVSFTRSLPA